MPPASPLRQRLETALRDALRARDSVARSALRSALAAIDNATAVPSSPAPVPAGSVRAEVAERRAAALGP